MHYLLALVASSHIALPFSRKLPEGTTGVYECECRFVRNGYCKESYHTMKPRNDSMQGL